MVVHAPAHANKEVENSKVPHEATTIKAIHLKEEGQLQDGNKAPDMKVGLMATVILVMDLVTRLWIAHSKEGKILEVKVIK